MAVSSSSGTGPMANNRGRQIEQDVAITAAPPQVLAAFFDPEALAVWWRTTRAITTPRPLGIYAVEWRTSPFQDDVFGTLGGVFYGTVMEFRNGRQFFVADDYWLPTLVNAMESPDSDERYSAARAAGEIASEDAVIPLAALLDDDALDVVEAAAAALGEIGGPVAGEQLEGYDSHPDPAVRGAVQAGLRAAAFDGDPLGLGAMSDPDAPPLVSPERGAASPTDG